MCSFTMVIKFSFIARNGDTTVPFNTGMLATKTKSKLLNEKKAKGPDGITPITTEELC